MPIPAGTPVAVQPVYVTANVTVSPEVRCKEPTVVCVGPPQIVGAGDSPTQEGTLAPDGKCRLTIAQTLLVSIPMEFGAAVVCEAGEVFRLPARTVDNPQPEDAETLLAPAEVAAPLHTPEADSDQQQRLPVNLTARLDEHE